MRLIDADALLIRMKKDALYYLVERYGMSEVIEAEPTVDAIPVEWIAEWVTTHDEFCWSRMLHDWKTERKEE